MYMVGCNGKKIRKLKMKTNNGFELKYNYISYTKDGKPIVIKDSDSIIRFIKSKQRKEKLQKIINRLK
jgi:hypothetical protein